MTSQRILIVEPDRRSALLIRALIERSEFKACEVVRAKTLAEAIGYTETGAWLVILLTLELPDSETKATIDALPYIFSDQNVVVLLEQEQRGMEFQVMQTGVQDCLEKGKLSTNLLNKTVRYSIARSRILMRMEESQQAAQVGTWEYDPSTHEVTASRQFYYTFGLTRSAQPLKLAALLALVAPEDIDKFKYELREVVPAGNVSRTEIRIQRADGSSKYLVVRSELMQIQNEHDTKILYKGIALDITDRRRAEEELERSRARYRAIFEQSNDAIYLSSTSGRFIDFNKAALSLLGYTEDELRFTYVTDLFEDPTAATWYTEQNDQRTFTTNMDVWVRRKNGSRCLCRLSTGFISTDDFIGIQGFIRDITDLHIAEEIKQQQQLTEQTATMKEQFLANVSHEMRTPLNGILGMTHLLLRTEPNEEQQSYLKSVQQSSENLLGIINDILEVSKLQFGDIDLDVKPFALPDVLTNLRHIVKYKADESRNRLTTRIEDNVPTQLKGDVLRLSQILINLTTNALKFTDDGEVSITVRLLNSTDDGCRLAFEVRDTGMGIPADKLESIFETFTQIKDAKQRNRGGTGLGLAICKNLVETQGGRIWVESELHKGSTFHFELPFALAATETVVAPKAAERPELIGTQTLRILLAEDHKMNQLVAVKTIQKEFGDRIHITVADNGRIAIDLLAAEPFDLVLMDVQMPEMDGIEATAVIRQMPAPKNSIPILAMTAHVHFAQNERYREYGMNDYVLKPFRPAELFQKLVQYLNAATAADTDPTASSPTTIPLIP